MRVIVTDTGTTLERLAAREWGDWTLWPLIRDTNARLQDRYGPDWSTDVPPGVPLLMPDVPTERRLRIVQNGDTWNSIALQEYGTEHFGRRLARANGFRACRDLIDEPCVVPALADPLKIQVMQAAVRR